MDKGVINFSSTENNNGKSSVEKRAEATSEGATADRKALLNAVRMIYEKGGEEHRIPIDVWRRLPKALLSPFAITKYYKIVTDKITGEKERGEFKGYNVYTTIQMEDAYVVVGTRVKNMGQNLEINSISTVFGRSKKGGFEEVLYRSKKITPKQSALLDGTRPHPYPTT